MKHSEYSVVIVGSGAAGLYLSLKIADGTELPDGILLVTKSNLGESNSKYAQGGIVGVMKGNNGDCVEMHVADTLKAGAGLTDESVARHISETSDEVIRDLINYDVKFDRDSRGNLNYTLEAAHSFKRIMHVGGDATGKGIVDALARQVRVHDNINVAEDSMAVELLLNKDKCCKGIILYNSLTNEHEVVYSNVVVLATGGLGQIYKYTTNPEGATGDGFDLAYNAGAKLQDMEFVQFHPTALALSPSSGDRFLISEAVRGEGAKLVDNTGREFMSKYHDKKELAPRDIVTRAIFNEMKVSKTNNVFLNTSFIDGILFRNRFPTISKKCIEKGIDLKQNLIPVAPAAHYFMGGIKSDVEGKTSIRGLYAIGETACTGLHGANRLASNSLLECVVCAYELADYLSFANLETPKIIDSSIMQTIDAYSAPLNDVNYDINSLKLKLKALMWDKVGILRNETDLESALEEIKDMKDNFSRDRKCADIQEYEYRNMLTVSKLVTEAALARKESRGAHSRSDYSLTEPEGKHSVVFKTEEKELVDVK